MPIASVAQAMVDQLPKFDNAVKKRKRRRENQVIGKAGIIRPDKRKKVRYL